MKRSKFSLSHYRLFTCKMGYILPIGLTEVLPGDSIRHCTSIFMRLAPMLAPVMHPVRVTIHHWYVPNRLVWDEWEDFITGGPDNTSYPEFPTISANFSIGSLADYLGLPPGFDISVSALPFRAYALIYNEWYRDQDLEDELPISIDSGADTTTSQKLMRGDWERDYFTTARPWPQKGPQVTVPVNNSGDGKLTATTNINVLGEGIPTFSRIGTVRDGHNTLYTEGGTNTNPMHFGGPQSGNQVNVLKWLNPSLGATTTISSSGTPGFGSIDINQFREAMAFQKYAEHRALYGSRYTEYLRYLGVRSSDARLQRPEYLGGGRQTIQFSEVLQTAEGADPVGTLRGHGIAAMRSNRYRRFFEEHGYIISLMLVRPKAIYMQGIPRTWLRRTKTDFWQREFEHTGQQPILKQELYAGAAANADFGYQNIYDSYRQQVSNVAGEFRDILDYWHMARNFSNEPELNADFISAVPTERIFAAQQNDQLYVMANHSMQARRLMAKYGNPI